MRNLALSAVMLALGAAPALASSQDAWDAFRAGVEKACLGAAADSLTQPKIVVDPFGTDHYGIAVITGTSRDPTAQPLSLACVYDKAAQTAEISQGFEADALQVTIPDGK
ncbi:hypothetical protein [Rhizobium halophytocola]|uniref:Uncharacterized protein n=1 Tax=Rhizobium halophytocola TaxID=735519 RepID=A0ABS4DWW7_9HYPH|nr:hypothetical protein [Rhizobium halophytocola]MBP1850184.1 hypothetical protein [Rhizobium halophytocola]